MEKQFDFKDEKGIYKLWEESGFFSPESCIEKGITSENAKPFSIILPPPNVTGHLHVGHAAMLAIEDLMVRHHRMKGDKTLWIPGTDHAAIATQEKVERILYKEEGKTRHDLGREVFLKKVDDFAKNSHDVIVNQVKRMGASIDWSREAFTLDEKRSLAVRTAFKKMYDDKIIYRGHRIVNWDPKLKTTVSDDEIERKNEKSTFYYLKYGPFEIATSRPETKFGDKYVVMHPKDERYSKYKHGEKIELEWINGPITATIIKDEAIDMEFGTGVMTITPWHDTTDFEIAQRHKLEKEQIIDFDGKLLPIAGEFAGMEIHKAREKIVSKLEEKGLLVKRDDEYIHDIAVNSRGGGVIEPQIKEQWFINVNSEFNQAGKKVTLKKLMKEAVSSGKIKIAPKRFEKVYYHWIDNLRDWCISRQIWYGHQIPVWYKDKQVYCGIEAPEGAGWKQDSDTLDTWFSSGLWTFSTLGWPEKTKNLENYHPTTVMETGYDILFFWVARMILMSEYLLGEIPFENIYLHGLVRDEKGRKMSKSLGNVIDPLDVSDKFGTDAVRLSLLIGATPGNDIKISEEKISSFRNFVTKLWNISRYATQSDENFKLVSEISKDDIKTVSDAWIIGRLNSLVRELDVDLEKFRFSMAGEKLKSFTWDDLADWYLEINKIEKNSKVLGYVLNQILKLWHPFVPFVTEKIWSEFSDEILMIQKWPEATKEFIDSEAAKAFDNLTEIISKIRNLRASYHIEPAKIIDVFGKENPIIAKLARVKFIGEKEDKKVIHILVGEIKIGLDVSKLVDIQKELENIKKEIANLEKLITKNEGMLANEGFVKNASEDVIKETKNRMFEYNLKIEGLKESKKGLLEL